MNLEVFGDQNIKFHILGEEKKVSCCITFVFPNSKEGSVNCPVMQSEKTWEGSVTVLPVLLVCLYLLPSLAWPKHQL